MLLSTINQLHTATDSVPQLWHKVNTDNSLFPMASMPGLAYIMHNYTRTRGCVDKSVLQENIVDTALNKSDGVEPTCSLSFCTIASIWAFLFSDFCESLFLILSSNSFVISSLFLHVSSTFNNWTNNNGILTHGLCHDWSTSHSLNEHNV